MLRLSMPGWMRLIPAAHEGELGPRQIRLDLVEDVDVPVPRGEVRAQRRQVLHVEDVVDGLDMGGGVLAQQAFEFLHRPGT